MDDEKLCAHRGRDASRMVDHAERTLALSVVLREVAENRGDRGMDREGDLVLLRELSEAPGPFPFRLHPEAALEVDLTGRIAPLDEELDGGFRAFPAGHACRAEADFHVVRRQGYGLRAWPSDPHASSYSSWTSTSASPTSGARPAAWANGISRWSRRSSAPRTARATATR